MGGGRQAFFVFFFLRGFRTCRSSQLSCGGRRRHKRKHWLIICAWQVLLNVHHLGHRPAHRHGHDWIPASIFWYSSNCATRLYSMRCAHICLVRLLPHNQANATSPFTLALVWHRRLLRWRPPIHDLHERCQGLGKIAAHDRLVRRLPRKLLCRYDVRLQSLHLRVRVLLFHCSVVAVSSVDPLLKV